MANTIKIKRSSTPASVPALVYGEIAYCTDGKLYCGNASDVAAQVNSTDGGFYEVITISAHPANQTASGGSATFSVTASTAASHAMTYQWSRSTNSGSTWATITGATSSSLALSSLTSGENGYYYRVAITSGLTVATSNSATLTVLAAALTPTFGSTTSTAGGFTVSITNYDALYTWAGTATASGSVSVSGAGLVTVTGVAASTSSTATITTTRAGYAGGSATVTATSSAGSSALMSFTNLYNQTNTATYSVTGTSTITASVTGGNSAAHDARLWLLANVGGTLGYTVTASSEATYDGGRLYSTSSSPAQHTGYSGVYDVASIANLTNVSGAVTGTETSTGTVNLTAGQYLVLRYSMDSGGSTNNNSITAVLNALITPALASPQTGNRTVVFTANFSSYMSMYTWSVTGTGNSVTSGSGTTTPSIYFTTTTGTFTVTCSYYGPSMQPLSATASYTII